MTLLQLDTGEKLQLEVVPTEIGMEGFALVRPFVLESGQRNEWVVV